MDLNKEMPAKEKESDLTDERAEETLAMQHRSDELNDEELDKVAGGFAVLGSDSVLMR